MKFEMVRRRRDRALEGPVIHVRIVGNIKIPLDVQSFLVVMCRLESVKESSNGLVSLQCLAVEERLNLFKPRVAGEKQSHVFSVLHPRQGHVQRSAIHLAVPS